MLLYPDELCKYGVISDDTIFFYPEKMNLVVQMSRLRAATDTRDIFDRDPEEAEYLDNEEVYSDVFLKRLLASDFSFVVVLRCPGLEVTVRPLPWASVPGLYYQIGDREYPVIIDGMLPAYYYHKDYNDYDGVLIFDPVRHYYPGAVRSIGYDGSGRRKSQRNPPVAKQLIMKTARLV